MTDLERQIRRAQHRLWVNRWLSDIATASAVLGGAFALMVLVQRLWDLPIPLGLTAMAFLAAAAAGSFTLTMLRRETVECAAIRLDEAAGLRERLSSGWHCLSSDDPFAQAVLADADRTSRSLSARTHLKLIIPSRFVFSATTLVLAALMFLVTPGLLKSTEAKEAGRQSAEAKETRVAVKRQLDEVKRIAEETPVLEDMKADLDTMDIVGGPRLDQPGVIRHEALKKIDKLEDAIRQKRSQDQYEAMPELQKMLRNVKVPESSEAPTQKLAKALSNADFKTAQEELKALKEQMATLKSDEDKAMAEKLGKQLEEIAKQLEEAAKNENLLEELEQAGISKEQLDRLLERLSKEDIEQVKKMLEEKGFNQQQIEKLAKRMQQSKQAGAMAKKLTEGLRQANKAQGTESGDNEGGEGLSLAEEQLSEMEQLEQEMNQLDSAMAAVQNAKQNVDKPCPNCKGSGQQGGSPCSKCSKPGQGGMGQMGQGKGGLANSQPTDVDFKTEKVKVPTGKGAIIGRLLVDGEQVAGEVSKEFAQTLSAAEREASDLIHRDRIPRQYHKAVKGYFSSVQKSIDAKKDGPAGGESHDKEVEGGTPDPPEKEPTGD